MEINQTPTKRNKQPAIKRLRRSKCMRLLLQTKKSFFRARRQARYRDLLEVIVWLPAYKVSERDLLHLLDDMWLLQLGGCRVTIKPRLPQTSTSQKGLMMWWYEGKSVFRTELNLLPEADRDRQPSFLSIIFLFPREFESIYQHS